MPAVPADLSQAQRLVAALAVLALHLAAGVWWWQHRTAVPHAVAAEPIEVQLVAPEAPVPAAPPRAEPTPKVRTAAEPARPVPSPPAPAAPRTPPVLTSTQPAAFQAPAVATQPQEAPTQAPAAPATTTVASASSLATAAPAEAARAPAPVREFSASQASYLVPPVLNYPPTSLELRETGTVLLRVLVDEKGRPSDVQVLKSSGFPRLDRQAVKDMKAARFKPYIDNGVPSPMWMRAPMTFELQEF